MLFIVTMAFLMQEALCEWQLYATQKLSLPAHTYLVSVPAGEDSSLTGTVDWSEKHNNNLRVYVYKSGKNLLGNEYSATYNNEGGITFCLSDLSGDYYILMLLILLYTISIQSIALIYLSAIAPQAKCGTR